jgi:hypothetical protein
MCDFLFEDLLGRSNTRRSIVGWTIGPVFVWLWWLSDNRLVISFLEHCHGGRSSGLVLLDEVRDLLIDTDIFE